MRNNELVDDLLVRVLARLKESGADRISFFPTARKDHILPVFPGKE